MTVRDNVRKILFVDDEESIRYFVTYYFEKTGRQIVTAKDAESALEFIDSETWDVVFCDYGLPKMDGIEFLRQLGRRQPETLKILVTGHSKKDVVDKACRAGIDKTIEKPFTVNELAGCLSAKD